MSRYRKIRKWGNTYVIVLDSKDLGDLGWKVDGLVDVDDCDYKIYLKKKKTLKRG